MRSLLIVLIINMSYFIQAQHIEQVNDGNLPDNFPTPEILFSSEPSPGYFFVSPAGLWGHFEDAIPYLVIMDNYGTPIFFIEQERQAFDFKLQLDGTITYAHGTNGYRHTMLDDKWQFIKETGAVHADDFHDFMVLEDGNYLTLANDYRIVDMSELVEGGHTDVTVIGNIIRIADPDGNVLFEWNTFDHIPITDAGDQVDLTDPESIDYAHVNSIERDSDSSIVFSSRFLNEVTRISTTTGEIIWRLGGKKNEFTFQDDTCKFYEQHDARYHGNGVYSIYDNNSGQTIGGESRFIKYEIDEAAMTATVLQDVRNRPQGIHGSIMGNGQVLPDGNIVVGWGSGNPNVSEFDNSGTKVFEMAYEAVSYRAFKYDWEPQAITFYLEEADFGKVSVDKPSTMSFKIFNNRAEDVEINYVQHRNSLFSLSSELPFIIPANGESWVELQIDPNGAEGVFEDVVTFCSDTKEDGNHQRIAGQIKAKATAEYGIGLAEESFIQIKVYPNPISDQVIIDKADFEGKINKLKVFNQLGQLVIEQSGSTSKSTLKTNDLQKGLYLLHIYTDKGVDQRKLIKQ